MYTAHAQGVIDAAATGAQETFEEALWPRHLEYRDSALATTTAAAKGSVHILNGEQLPAHILADALPIVDEWAGSVVAGGRHSASAEKAALVAREMDALAAASTAAEKVNRRAAAL